MHNLCSIGGLLKTTVSSKKKICDLMYTTKSVLFSEFLYRSGYLVCYKNVYGTNHFLKRRLILRYFNGLPVLKSLEMRSKPSHYLNYTIKAFNKIKQYNGTHIILSTSKGFLTHHDGLKLRVGGISLFRIN